jgi:hypothetical protein
LVLLIGACLRSCSLSEDDDPEFGDDGEDSSSAGGPVFEMIGRVSGCDGSSGGGAGGIAIESGGGATGVKFDADSTLLVSGNA